MATMANYGGGVLVYGVTDDNSHAGSRLDVGEVDDNYIQAYQSVGFRSWRCVLLADETNRPESYLGFHDDGSVSALVSLPITEENRAVVAAFSSRRLWQAFCSPPVE